MPLMIPSTIFVPREGFVVEAIGGNIWAIAFEPLTDDVQRIVVDTMNVQCWIVWHIPSRSQLLRISDEK